MRAMLTSHLAAYLATAVVMVGFDFVWLRTTVEVVYWRAVGPVLAEKPNIPAAIAFYVMYVAGVVLFAIRPALATGDWRTALWRGAALGLFAYGTYDLTNLATLKVWSLKVAALDMAWGAVLTGTAASAGAAAGLAAR